MEGVPRMLNFNRNGLLHDLTSGNVNTNPPCPMRCLHTWVKPGTKHCVKLDQRNFTFIGDILTLTLLLVLYKYESGGFLFDNCTESWGLLLEYNVQNEATRCGFFIWIFFTKLSVFLLTWSLVMPCENPRHLHNTGYHCRACDIT